MKDYIGKITHSPFYCNKRYKINGMNIDLKVECPICHNHSVSAFSYTLEGIFSDVKGMSTIRCVNCSEGRIISFRPDIDLDEYKAIINYEVPNWLKAIEKDDKIHAWKRRCLYDVVNGNEQMPFLVFASRELDAIYMQDTCVSNGNQTTGGTKKIKGVSE